MRIEKRERVTNKFEKLKELVEFVATYHSDHNVRRQASCEVLNQNSYISMAQHPNKGQNTINPDILKRCNKIHKQYLLWKAECKTNVKYKR
jgi:hypothetical protein